MDIVLIYNGNVTEDIAVSNRWFLALYLLKSGI